MRSLPAGLRLSAALAALICFGLPACESTDPPRKKRPPLPGEEVSELSWGRPTGPNDVPTPFGGLPMSR